jgi:hypothetical protein
MKTPDQIAADIRIELRSIVRGLQHLRQPFTEFDDVPGLPEGHPRFRLKQAACYEEVQRRVLEVAGAIWHLKDRLKLWVAARSLTISPTIEELVAGNLALLLCSDLINAKKHGECKNRSGYGPRLGGLRIDINGNGAVAMRYDGAAKEDEILVTHRVPVPFQVEIISGDGRGTFGNAAEVIEKAFDVWRQVICQLGILAAPDPESQLLLRHLRGEVTQPGTLSQMLGP